MPTLLSLRIYTAFFVPSEVQFLEKLPENHLMVWVGLKRHLVPVPLSWAGHLPMEQVAQSPI